MGFMSGSYKGHSAVNRTPGQQRNVQAKQAETSNYSTQARLGGAAGRVNTPAQGKRNMQPPAAPQMHSAVSPRQMSATSSVKNALSKLKTLKRLTR